MSGTTSDDLESGQETAGAVFEKAENDHIVDWDGPDDPENPRNWSSMKRNTHIALVGVSTLLANLAAVMYSPGASQLVQDFGITGSILPAFTVGIYLLGFAFGPLVISPLSEVYGRLPWMHLSLGVMVVFVIGCAVSTNQAMFFVFRFITGCAASAPLTVGGAIIADVTTIEQRGKAMATWAVGPLIGPVAGPIIGGFVAENLSWRWAFWIISMLAGTILVIQILVMRESNAIILLRRRALRLRKETGRSDLIAKGDTNETIQEIVQRAIVRPFKLLIMSPIVTLVSLYNAIAFGLIYLLFTTFPDVFETQYGFSVQLSGLSYLGMGIGMLLGLCLFYALNDRIYNKLKADKGGKGSPEMRLPLMFLSPIMAVGFFWYGWSAQSRTHWVVPIIGTSFIGIGSLFTMLPSQLYLVDAFGPQGAASALAANTLFRFMAGSFLTLAGPPMYDALGFGWGNSILGFLCAAFMPVPILFYRYGSWLRERYVFKL